MIAGWSAAAMAAARKKPTTECLWFNFPAGFAYVAYVVGGVGLWRTRRSAPTRRAHTWQHRHLPQHLLQPRRI
jgi:hypothetical protein